MLTGIGVALLLAAIGIVVLKTMQGAKRFFAANSQKKMVVGENFLLRSDLRTGSRMAPSIEFFQQREISSMKLYTDDRGNRVFGKGEKARPASLILLGDSFVLGSGNVTRTALRGC